MDQVRWEKVRRFRRAIARGTYVTEERLDKAAARLAEELNIKVRAEEVRSDKRFLTNPDGTPMIHPGFAPPVDLRYVEDSDQDDA